VGDFGLSTLLGSQQETRVRKGTFDYLAPEVFQGRVTSQTDQYALAITYCIVRGGRFPFPNTPTSFDREYVRPAPDLTMLSPEERPLISRALNTIPQDRWPSCRELFRQLEGVICRGIDRKTSSTDRLSRPGADQAPGMQVRLSKAH
jgi:serine/threonine protein kinase